MNLNRRLLLFVLLVMTSCSSTTLAPAEADAEAKRFVVPAGKARIYLVRCSSQGGVVLMQANLDGRVLGDLQARSYLVVDVAPGHHVVSLGAPSLGSQVKELSVDADTSYYVVLHAFHTLQLDTTEAGQACVRSTTRAMSVFNTE
jgi:hypothetical protein